MSTKVEGIPFIEIQAAKEDSRTLLGSLKLHRGEIFKILLLITFVICISYVLVNNPGKFVTNYSSIFICLILISSAFLFYKTLKSNAKFVDFKFDIVKNCIVLVCFIVLAFFFYYYNPGGYVMDNISTPIYILIFTSGLFCVLYTLLYIYSANGAKSNFVDSGSTDFKDLNKNESKIFTIMKYFFALATSVCFLVIFILFGTKIVGDFSTMSVGKLTMNIIMIIVFAALIFKIITYTNFYQNSPLTQLIINSIFYIPCILVALIDNFVKITGLDSKDKSKKMTEPTKTDYILLAIAIILNVVYFAYPYAAVKFSKQGGTMLINNPIYTNDEHVLASYQSLNGGTDDFDYTYAISFWVYIDAANPSTSNAYTKYTSLLNYGGKPNVLYKGTDNTLMITMDNASAPKTSYKQAVPYELDESGNRIIYVKKDVLLQKWNNIIINYNGGTLDIFYNGELVKSAIEVVPYMKYDTLTVGSKNGIRGGICSVNYFNKSLDVQQIYNLYHFVKDNTPPVYKSSEETIVNVAKDVPGTLNKASINNYTNALREKVN
jgi:hypothetical protein